MDNISEIFFKARKKKEYKNLEGISISESDREKISLEKAYRSTIYMLEKERETIKNQANRFREIIDIMDMQKVSFEEALIMEPINEEDM